MNKDIFIKTIQINFIFTPATRQFTIFVVFDMLSFFQNQLQKRSYMFPVIMKLLMKQEVTAPALVNLSISKYTTKQSNMYANNSNNNFSGSNGSQWNVVTPKNLNDMKSTPLSTNSEFALF